MNQGAGNGNALLLPAGKFGGFVLHTVSQTDRFKRSGSPITALGSDAGVAHGQFYICQRGLARKKIETLEDKTNLAVANTGELIIVEFGNRLQEEGMERRKAVIEAAVLRLRPILTPP